MMRPVLTREEYMALRDSERQRETLKAVREGHEELKNRLAQMNYSCLPNGDGTLKGTTRMSSTIGMDIDHVAAEEMESLKERILSKKESLGLLMLEESARGRGYHLVFRRRTELSQEENLRWASGVMGVEYDTGAKDITRVFFTTTAKELLFLDDEIFRLAESSFVGGDLKSPTHRIGIANPDEQASPTQGNGIANADEQRANPDEQVTVADSDVHSASANVQSSTLDVQCFKGIPYSSIIKEYWLRTGGRAAAGGAQRETAQTGGEPSCHLRQQEGGADGGDASLRSHGSGDEEHRRLSVQGAAEGCVAGDSADIAPSIVPRGGHAV